MGGGHAAGENLPMRALDLDCSRQRCSSLRKYWHELTGVEYGSAETFPARVIGSSKLANIILD